MSRGPRREDGDDPVESAPLAASDQTPDWSIPESDLLRASTMEPLAMSMMARAAHRLVRLYQAAFSGRPSPCRYVPTCSSYALDAYEQQGFFRGSWLALRRVGRCNPWGGKGWDPVPPRKVDSIHDRKAL